MRISSNESHPDYPHHDPSLIFASFVFLNGKELNHCHFADEQRGEAWVYDQTEGVKGRVLLVVNDDLVTRILLGDVRIRSKNNRKICFDCGTAIGKDTGPLDGWQIEDGRTICHSCCVEDMRVIAGSKGNHGFSEIVYQLCLVG